MGAIVEIPVYVCVHKKCEQDHQGLEIGKMCLAQADVCMKVLELWSR